MNALFDFTDKPNQKAFFHSRARNVGFWGGYGNGKTYAGCGKGFLHSLYYPGNVGLVGRKTYPALNSTTRETFLSLCRKLNGGSLDNGPYIAGFNKQENLLRFRNGSIVFFRTLDEVEKLRSLNLGWAVVDQAEEIDEDIYFELNARIRFWNEERVAEFVAKNGDSLKKELGFVPIPFSQLICVGNPSPKMWVRREFKDNERGLNDVYQASTLENKKFLPMEYISQLELRFPKEWVEKFVMGSWETMLGQIYKDFDYENIHAIPPFDIPKHWRRFIAMDHGVVNPTAVLWGAVDELGRVYVYREYYKANAGVDEHAEAIKSLCQLDGSTPMTQDGKIQIYMDYAIKGDYDPHGISTWEHYSKRGIFGLDADKRVLDGIQNLQVYLKPRQDQTYPEWHPKAGKIGAPKLYIMDGCCPWLVKELKAYEWEETKEGQNAPERPKKHFDHACFVAGTQIQTADGSKPIETLGLGQLVWTRQGLRPVVAVALTEKAAPVYTVTFSNGASLTATGNHPVWIEGAGFVRVDALRYGQRAHTLEQTWKPNGITASCIGVGRESATSNSTVPGCIGRFGKTLTALFRRATTFTTKMGTALTTRFPILSAWTLENTTSTTPTTGQRGTRPTWLKSGSLQRRGTLAPRAASGTSSTESTSLRTGSLSRSIAGSAARTSNQRADVQDSALTTAKATGEGSPGLTTSKLSAPSAELSSPKTSTPRLDAAPLHVVGVSRAGTADVYNLTVDEVHEYFANGILVSNCDSIRYLAMAIKDATSAPVPEPRYRDDEHKKQAEFVQYVFTRSEDEDDGG